MFLVPAHRAVGCFPRFFTGLLAFVVLGVAVAPKTKSSQIFGLAIGELIHVPNGSSEC